MGYDSAGLRAGAGGHDEAGAAAGRVATALAAAVVPAGVFGRVTAAAGFAAAVEVARDGLGRAAGAEAANRAGLAARVRSAADLGDGLTAATTSIARSMTPGSITAGMAG